MMHIPGPGVRYRELEMNESRVASSARAATAPLMRWMTVGVLVVAAASAAVSAHAQGRGPGMPGHGPGPDMMMFGGPPEHVARAVDHMLDGLSVTDAQRTQIRQIAQSAAVDLKAQREGNRGLHAKGMQIFAAPTLDAAAAEALRQQMLTQHDQATKRMLQAMLDIGKELTPEQRATIAERMKQRQATMQDRMQRMRGDAASTPRQ